MKRIIFLFFIMVSIKAVAQNYAPFKPGVVYVFLSPSNYFWEAPPAYVADPTTHTIYIDTQFVSGTDTLFMNYNHIIIGSMSCLKFNRAFFMGREMIKRNNGDFLFTQNNNDTICLKTFVQPNDTFVFLSEKLHPDSNYFAVVKSRQFETFDGTNDTVITYSIIRLNQLHQLINSQTNFKEIKISRSFGLIQWVFPGASVTISPTHCSDRNFGKPYPSVKNLNAYEKGDIFEYSIKVYGPNSPYKYERRRIIDKLSSALNDTIQYRIEISTINLYYKQQGISYDTLEVTILNADADDAWCNHNAFFKNPYPQGQYAYILCDSGGFVLNQRADLFKSNTDSCLHQPLDGVSSSSLHRPGIGLVSSITPINLGDNAELKNLYYFKKGNTSWGTPANFNLLLNQDNLPEEKHISIYPNPVQDILNIELNEHKPAQFTLYDLVGKEVFACALNEGKNELAFSSIPPGVYFYSVQSGEGVTTQGKIIRK
ncbi:MAG: T9SS type A sorting domain-containing protein [Bacteroidia bacterium]|nr:T9SS type A sorting domain-containing protein [Bacteroidia bacterium]